VKIMYYANYSLSEGDAPSNHIIQICAKFKQRGNKVLLFTRKTGCQLAKYGLKTFRVPIVESNKHKTLRRISKVLWRALANAAMMLFRPSVLYQRDRADDWIPLSLSLRWGVPLVVEVNGWYPMDVAEKRGHEVYWEVYWKVVELLRPRYEHAAALITSSPGLRELILSTFRVSPDRVVYISNGTDLDMFRSVKPYKPGEGDKFVLGMIAGYHPHIDIKSVLKAISFLLRKKIPIELRLYTYANDEDKERIQLMVQEMNLVEFVKILPKVPYYKLPEVLSQIDVCLAIYKKTCLEKHKSIEAAMKLWDYWASQRPVIATDLPWTYSYHHHLEKRLLAIPPEDPQSLAQAIETLFRSPDLARTIAMNGYHYVQSGHSWADVAARIEEVLRKVVTQR